MSYHTQTFFFVHSHSFDQSWFSVSITIRFVSKPVSAHAVVTHAIYDNSCFSPLKAKFLRTNIHRLHNRPTATKSL